VGIEVWRTGGRIGGIYTESTISSRAAVADPPRRCSTQNGPLSQAIMQLHACFSGF
jgi:hypothetical protein